MRSNAGELTRTEVAFKTAQTHDLVVVTSYLGNLGEYMHVYGDDGEDDAMWASEETVDSTEDTLPQSESNPDSTEVIVADHKV